MIGSASVHKDTLAAKETEKVNFCLYLGKVYSELGKFQNIMIMGIQNNIFSK